MNSFLKGLSAWTNLLQAKSNTLRYHRWHFYNNLAYDPTEYPDYDGELQDNEDLELE